MDIDGDGTDELLIYGSEDLWEDLAIFSFNSNTQQISLIPAMNYDSDEPQQISVLSAYGKIKYSENIMQLYIANIKTIVMVLLAIQFHMMLLRMVF